MFLRGAGPHVCPRFAPPPSTNPILCCPGTTPLVLRCSNGDHVPVDTNHSQSCSRNWPMYARRALLLSIQCPAGGCLQHVSSRVTPLAHGRLHSRRRTCRDCRGTPLYNTQEHWGKHRVSAPYTRVMIEFVQEKILGRNREFQGSVAGHMVFGGARITATAHHAAAVGVLPTLSPGAPDKGVLHTRPHATATLCGGCVRGSGFGAGYLLSDAACPPWILSAPEIV